MEHYLNEDLDPLTRKLKLRAIESAKSTTDNRLLEWIAESSELLFSDEEEIFCAIASNPNINIRTAIFLISHSSPAVRKATLHNESLPAGLLYGLAFDNEPRIRAGALSHPNRTEELFEEVSNVERNHGRPFTRRKPSNDPRVASINAITSQEEFLNEENRLKFLSLAYGEESYWEWFARSSGYTSWYLKSLMKQATRISIRK